MLALTEVDGGWSTWGPWDDCNVTCQLGTRTRSRYVFYKFQIFKRLSCGKSIRFCRTCTNPAPSGGGAFCPGPSSKLQRCVVPVNCPPTTPPPTTTTTTPTTPAATGVWGQWGQWSDCMATCGRGERTRSRRGRTRWENRRFPELILNCFFSMPGPASTLRRCSLPTASSAPARSPSPSAAPPG